MDSKTDNWIASDGSDYKNSPLPDAMYSRDVAIRLLRHACFYIFYTRKEMTDALLLIAAHQHDVLKMSTADFYRIKIMGALEHRMNVCPCACHLTQSEPCDTCERLHVRN